MHDDPFLPPRVGVLEDFLIQRLAAARKRTPADIDPQRPFNELGIDSLDAITLIGEVEERFGWTIDPGELFDHPTPRALAIHLAGRRPHDPS